MDIDIEEVLLFVNGQVFEKTQKRLTEVHAQIFRKSWYRERYPQISVDLHLTQ
jgi:hypothetical protein